MGYSKERKRHNCLNTSGLAGVSLNKQTGKYVAYIHKNNKKIHLGYFDTKEEAEQARIKAGGTCKRLPAIGTPKRILEEEKKKHHFIDY